jgi:hypothetical protein
VSGIVASFVQRSANDRVDSTLLLMAVASGLLDALPTVLTKLLLVVAHYDTTESYLLPAVGLWTAGITASSAVAARGIWSVAGRLTATVYVLSSVLGAAATMSPSVREVLAAIGWVTSMRTSLRSSQSPDGAAEISLSSRAEEAVTSGVEMYTV